LAGMEERRDAVQDDGAFAIPEADLVKTDLAPHGREDRRVGRVTHLGHRVEEREDAVRGAERLLHLSPLTRETTDRTRHHAEVEQERDKLAGRELPAGHLVSPEPEDDDR